MLCSIVGDTGRALLTRLAGVLMIWRKGPAFGPRGSNPGSAEPKRLKKKAITVLVPGGQLADIPDVSRPRAARGGLRTADSPARHRYYCDLVDFPFRAQNRVGYHFCVSMRI